MIDATQPVFLAADWSQLESWLTAFHANDSVMMAELKAQREPGGIKIHAQNAAMLYGIDPGDAKSHMVNLKGRMKPAYDAGKRISHLWNYGGKARMIAETLWLDLKFAKEVEEKLAAKYTATARWRIELADEVFGRGEFACVRCGRVGDTQTACEGCSRGSVRVPMRWTAWAQEPQREARTVFGRRRLYPGRRGESANALASQKPQSCGASMWWRTLMRLHGFEARDDALWVWKRPTGWVEPHLPAKGVCIDPTVFLHQREGITSGTYDSYLAESTRAVAYEVADWLCWTMEQPWSELNGLTIPCELKMGLNYGDWHEDTNPDGLKDLDRGEFAGAFAG